jgi:hypothetical protein
MPGYERSVIEQAGFDIEAQLPKGGATGDVLTKNSGADFDASFQPSSGGGGEVVTLKVTLASADLLALGITPVEAIPAPGAGKVIQLLSVFAVYRFGTTPYSVSNPPAYFTLAADAGAFDNTAQIEADGYIDQSSDQISWAQIDRGEGTIPLADAENQAFQISLSSTIPSVITDGDGAVDFYITYSVVTL